MQQFKWLARVAPLAGLVLGMISLNGCAFFPNRLPWQQWSDSATTSKVKKALRSMPNAHFENVKVSTFDHVVRLNGMVRSLEEKDRAVAVARRVEGVREVLDYLQVPGMKGNDQEPSTKGQLSSKDQ